MVPLVATLAKWGLPILASAVTSKGKDLIEEKLGVKLDDLLGTEQGRVHLKQLELEHEQFLIEAGIQRAEQELKSKQLDIENTKSARDMNSEIQRSKEASKIAKNAAYFLDFLIVGATLFMIALLMFKGVPSENKEIFFTAFGTLLGLSMTVVNFHRGTSSSSREKDETIKALGGVK